MPLPMRQIITISRLNEAYVERKQAITLPRKSRITRLESVGARTELSYPWVGPQAHRNSKPLRLPKPSLSGTPRLRERDTEKSSVRMCRSRIGFGRAQFSMPLPGVCCGDFSRFVRRPGKIRSRSDPRPYCQPLKLSEHRLLPGSVSALPSSVYSQAA